jgi:hypothetical protein
LRGIDCPIAAAFESSNEKAARELRRLFILIRMPNQISPIAKNHAIFPAAHLLVIRERARESKIVRRAKFRLQG